LNDFLQWLQSNGRALAIAAAGLLILSVLVGLAVGLAKRKADGRRVQGETSLFETSGENAVDERGERKSPISIFDLPPSIVPEIEQKISSYSFYLDRPERVLDGLDVIPLKTSDLLKGRAVDVEPDVEPFFFENEEYDVLMRSYEPEEP
jgi:hypothetical protein